MGDSDDSSRAAQGAQETDAELNGDHGDGGFFRRFFGFGAAGEEDEDEAGSGGETSREGLLGLGNLRRMRVEDVSIPKADIIAVPDTITRDDLVQVFRESGLTRLPVYAGTLDTPIGMAHLKDFALKHGFNGRDTRFNLKRLLRPLLFVPPSMPIGVLLTKMQTERRHMALVIDEYGGVDGLVTIEDLIEQVIGQIEDEHDTDEERNFTLERTGCYLALSKTPLEEFEAEIGFDLTDHEDVDGEEIDTLGGLVFMLAGHVPARGEVVPHPGGVEFEVVDADPRRIKRMRVRLPGAPGTAAAATRTHVQVGSRPEND
ncbi:Hemolysin C [Roseivivax jejudonensis]|uniref:Hemolysin C n=1 Tax=Roseivivax jejudonensis TaxID=1529041 RepID=A0A1X6Y8E3_9RHOB|nr:hemolysin family protein [Roseivivax jejudonensis]SLN13710.1 Hemolysin C [Roseivivax jejudonensis]